MEFLKPPKGTRSYKRIVGRGRGSHRGKTSGKGHNGQNARSGGGVRPGFEGGQMPIYRRVARRGFSNYPFRKIVTPVNLSALQRVFKSGETVTLQSLKDRRVVKKHTEMVKILATGEVKKKLTVKDLPMSQAARAKIEAAGGTVSGGSSVSVHEAGTAEETESDASVSDERAEDSPQAEEPNDAGSNEADEKE